jgi:predicted membrane-bound spermidine synthase
VYQVAWVRVFGNSFGNTIHSAAIVVAVFMLGLGIGSYAVGVWADRRYLTRAGSLLRSYGYIELGIALLGLGVTFLLPHFDQLASLVSSYSRDDQGWYILSPTSHLARACIAIAVLTPITVLMGGTLTLLIRHLVRRELEPGNARIAALYGINTFGAAAGCLLTDFVLVPAYGLRVTQLVAVFFNVVAGAGALYLGRRNPRPGIRDLRFGAAASGGDARHSRGHSTKRSPTTKRFPTRGHDSRSRLERNPRDVESLVPDHEPGTSNPESRIPDPASGVPTSKSPVVPIGFALALSGFAAMGMEILWFRHFTILLGQFRAVFSLLLTIILAGMALGSLTSAALNRRLAKPVELFVVIQALFVVTSLLGLFVADAVPIEQAARGPILGSATAATVTMESGPRRLLIELWFNARPMLLEVAAAALLMGFSFPLGNAIVQRAEAAVGRRAGLLYFANTAGAVVGSLATGFFLLPTLGIQGSATALMFAATVVIALLYLVSRFDPARSSAESPVRGHRSRLAFAGSLAVAIATLGWWLLLPADYVIRRALPRPASNEQLLALVEGVNEVVAATEVPESGRRLMTNGHPMSSTTDTAQRYMRALAHIPLLSIHDPHTALVIGFGVGNTTHAASLHPTMQRIEVADLSRDILEFAGYFRDVNADVLRDERVAVFINDGRQHLHMQPAESYDLITLEPPPIGYAGVASLYSREFYELARTRLKRTGYVSQWLPAYQVPTPTTLAMIRAFIDVFPEAVLLSGAESELLLLGVRDGRIEIDPDRLAAALSRAPAVHADLQRLDMGRVTEIVGTFVGSAQTLAEATRGVPPVTDDMPSQEYGVISLMNLGQAVPASVVDLSGVTSWCPACFSDGRPVASVPGLDAYLALLQQAYAASPEDVRQARARGQKKRVVAGSAYLGSIVPESADLHNAMAISLASAGKLDEAIAEFREALRLDPQSAETHWHLGAALASRGDRADALAHLYRSVVLDPTNGAAHNDLGATLAQQGRWEEATGHFERALALDPGFKDAQRNLDIARRARRRSPSN